MINYLFCHFPHSSGPDKHVHVKVYSYNCWTIFHVVSSSLVGTMRLLFATDQYRFKYSHILKIDSPPSEHQYDYVRAPMWVGVHSEGLTEHTV